MNQDAGRAPPWNVLVTGDNLAVVPRLPGLLSQAGLPARADLIYLDPPYNTGNTFAYRDRHGGREAWLAMLRPRLEAGRAVLAEHGAIFVSIDDHEVAHLRLLLDEVFGERAFIAQIVVNLNPKGRQLGRFFATGHEYLLVYAKDPAACVLDATSARLVDPRDFPRVDPATGERHRLLPLRNTNKKFNPRTAATLHYPLYGDPVTGVVAAHPFTGAVRIEPVFGDGTPAVWRWSAALVRERPGDLLCREVRGRGGRRTDVFQIDRMHPGRRKKLGTIWAAEEVGSTDTAVAELKALLGPVFASPKPTGLIRRIVETMPADAVVLDYFAGSGTTGHAVALANAEDGGTRVAVSVEHAAPTEPGSHARDLGFARICDITRARLAAVADTVGGGLLEIGPGR